MNPADLMNDSTDTRPGVVPDRTRLLVTALGGPQAELAAGVLDSTADSGDNEARGLGADTIRIAFVASPAWALAKGAEAGEDLGVVRDRWIHTARDLLERVQSDPASCLLLAAEEVLGAPQAASQYLRAQLGAAAGTLPSFVPIALPTPAELPLARLSAAQDSELRHLWEELSASCRLLAETAPEPDSPPSFAQLCELLGQLAASRRGLTQQTEQHQRLETIHWALQEAFELAQLQQRQACEELEQALAQLDASSARLEQTIAAHTAETTRDAQSRLDLEESLRQALAEIEQTRSDQRSLAEQHAAEVEELHRRLKTARSQGEEQAGLADTLGREIVTLQARMADSEQQRLESLRQLRQTQQQAQERDDRIEALQARAEELAQSLSAAQLQLHASSLDAQRHLDEAAGWSQRLQASCAAVDQHERRGVALVEEIHALRARLSECEAELADARRQWRLAEQTAQDRGSQLEQAELRSERLADQLDAALAGLESAATAGLADAAAAMQLTAVDLVDVRDEAPHRELSFSLQGWACPTGTLDDVWVRLVEHQGHPGLVFFTAADGRPALTQWQPSGTENGRPFMILLPADQRPDAPLMRMGPADWRNVVGLATLLSRDLRMVDGDGLHPHWRDIAARLCLELAALPSRLRYAALRGTVTGQGLEVQFEDIVFGSRSWGQWRLEWRSARPGGSGAALVWHLPQDSAAPLASWPVQDDGRYCAEHALPLGPGIDPAATRAWLQGLPGLDRDLLSALFDTLPAVAAQADVPSPIGAALLALRRDAHAAGRSLRVRRIARRVLGRITARS